MPPSSPPIIDRSTREERFARTVGDANSWQRVQDFRRLKEFQAENSDVGPKATAEALGLEKSYIHNWLYGSEPNAIKGLRTIDERGWLECEPGDRTFEALSVLSAWLFAGGSVPAAEWHPTWMVIRDRPRELLVESLDAVGVGAKSAYPGATLDATDKIKPEREAAILGRFLVGVLGAPKGTKAHTALEIPRWLATAPTETQRRWARTYVVVRGGPISGGGGVRVREANRSDGYHDALAAVFRAAAGTGDGLTRGIDALYLRGEVRDVLDVVPELPA